MLHHTSREEPVEGTVHYTEHLHGLQAQIEHIFDLSYWPRFRMTIFDEPI